MADPKAIVDNAMEYCEKLKESQATIQESLPKLDDEYDFARQKFVEHFNVLALELDNRKKELLGQLDKLKEYKARRLEDEKAELSGILDQLHELILKTNHAVEDKHEEDVQHFARKLQDFPRKPLPIPMAEGPKFQYTLDREEDMERVRGMGFLDFKPRVTGIAFPYKSDFDNNGILYWMGCDYGRAEYRNPARLGLVTVTASSCEYGDASHAVAHSSIASDHETFMTQSVAGSWLVVDLGVQYTVCPTAYTLRNCIINPCHSLANWDLQGSTDGKTWTTLRAHKDDRMLLPKRGSVYTWPVEGCKTFYSKFRILMTGPNQHTQPHARFYYLMLAGMELYGFVEKTPVLLPPKPPTTS
uniref:F5/8 type C domain-containing protein n=1 Tax=Eutreptiella gymnastica TaxID=73025 RepID=A0A7S1N3T9_9EUGL|mmetsp:Transcript_114653/g.199398  ORF Transcript_114653/g.199398 Transcript_114653/m.199398 type:complete len:358 (+) Transcript_114653:117-1190(+)